MFLAYFSDRKYSYQKNSIQLPQNSYIKKEENSIIKPATNSFVSPNNLPAEIQENKSNITQTEKNDNIKETVEKHKQENVNTVTPIEIPLNKIEDIQFLDPKLLTGNQIEEETEKQKEELKELQKKIPHPLTKKDFKENISIVDIDPEQSSEIKNNGSINLLAKAAKENVRKSFRKSTNNFLEKDKGKFNYLLVKFAFR